MMRKLTILLLDGFFFVMVSCLAVAGVGVVRIDQVGYLPSARKYVFVVQAADSFFLVNGKTGLVDFRGALTSWKANDPATGQNVFRGDFSVFQQTGEYRIHTSRGTRHSGL